MGGSNRVIRIVGTSGATDLVSPPRTDLSASRNLDDGLVLELDVCVTGKIGVADILDGEVTGRSANALELALVDAVDRHLLEDAVSVGGRDTGRGEGEEGGCLHFFLLRLDWW